MRCSADGTVLHRIAQKYSLIFTGYGFDSALPRRPAEAKIERPAVGHGELNSMFLLRFRHSSVASF